MSTPDAPSRFSPRWWVTDARGRLAIALWPNAALAVWIVSVVVGWTSLLDSARGATLTTVGRGALVVWALDELVRGSSPFRRILGAAVLVAELVSLFG